MYLFKQLRAGKISLRNNNGQVGEVMAYVRAINKLNTLGQPVKNPPKNSSHLGLGRLIPDS